MLHKRILSLLVYSEYFAYTQSAMIKICILMLGIMKNLAF
jgi:hypothetical protein